MKHCTVYRKRKNSICFDLYDEKSSFILSCSLDDSMTGVCLLTTIENCHRLDFDQLRARSLDRRIVGMMSSDWLTGLCFQVKNFQTQKQVCTIHFESRLLITKPIEFQLVVNDTEPVGLNQLQSMGIASDFSCLTDTSCTESMEFEDIEAEHDNKQYSTIKQASQNMSTVRFKTRTPIWNTELNMWLHNFGGRVRVPTYKCFIVIEDHTDSDADPTEVQNKIYLRHGKSSKASYILDYREPEISAMVALATMCAVHLNKSLIKTI